MNGDGAGGVGFIWNRTRLYLEVQWRRPHPVVGQEVVGHAVIKLLEDLLEVLGHGGEGRLGVGEGVLVDVRRHGERLTVVGTL